jgi:cytochrome P450
MSSLPAGPAAPAARTRRLAELPGPPRGLLLGNARQIVPSRLHTTLERWGAEYGRLFTIRLGLETVLVVNDHQLLAGLLRDRPDALGRSVAVREAIDVLVGQGVFSAEGERWRRQRRLVMKALTPEAVRHFFPTMQTMTGRLLRRWQAAVDAGRPIAFGRDLKAWSMDVAVALSFGEDIDALDRDDDPLQRDVEFLFRMIGRRVPAPLRYWKLFKLPIDREADRRAARIRERIEAIVSRARARLAADPSLRARPSNLLEALLAARDEPGSEFTDEDVIGNVSTLVFAGEDTTANTMAWLLLLLAGRPQETARLRAEADAVLGDEAVPASFASLDRLPRLDAALTEALRLKPAAPLQGFETLRDRIVDDVAVPRGARIIGLVRSAALSDAHFAEAADFRPERWLAENTPAGSGTDDPSRRIFPFGAGPRLCPGRYLAMIEMRMAASTILRHFELATDGDTGPVDEVLALTMGPDRMPIRLARRRPG